MPTYFGPEYVLQLIWLGVQLTEKYLNQNLWVSIAFICCVSPEQNLGLTCYSFLADV
jgi:hypothetical protein